MSTQYLDDIRRYQPNVNEAAVKGIVKHLGIALKSPDASMVSCSSQGELVRVMKEVGLTPENDKMPLDEGIKSELPDQKIR